MSNRDIVLSAMARVAEILEIKTVGQMVTQYRDQLTNVIYDTLNRHSDAADQRKAHKALLRQFAFKTVMEGIREILSNAEIDDEDRESAQDIADEWLLTQLPHVNQFAKDTEAARGDPVAVRGILNRVTLWVDALRNLGALGRAYANNNKKGFWVLGPTEHCGDCLRYSRLGPHRMSFWRARKLPRSPALECHGFHCQCDIVDGTGASLL